MKSRKRLAYVIGGILSFVLCALTFDGQIQRTIHFDGVLNEIAFSFTLFLLGIGLIAIGTED